MRRIAIASFVTIIGVLISQSSNAEHFKIWMKAFIPNVDLDIVVPVPNSSNLSMIPGPSLAGMPLDSTCYNTNNRGFDSSSDAEAKITVIVEFDIFSPGVANFSEQEPQIGQTLQYNCSTGEVLNSGTASNKLVSINNPVMNGNTIDFSIDAEAANPLVNLSPSIKIHGTISIETSSRTISFNGTVGRFPSYEIYASVDQADPIAVLQISPDHDSSPWSLLFTKEAKGSVSY